METLLPRRRRGALRLSPSVIKAASGREKLTHYDLHKTFMSPDGKRIPIIENGRTSAEEAVASAGRPAGKAIGATGPCLFPPQLRSLVISILLERGIPSSYREITFHPL